jgi:hypothetical protein
MGDLPAGLERVWRSWEDDLVDAYEERSAILEFGAGMPRDVAERQARELVDSIHEARNRARDEALLARSADEVCAENEARQARVDRENAAWSELSNRTRPNNGGRRRRWK